MGLTFLLSVAVSFSVIAQQPTATKGDGKAGTAKDGGATSTASPQPGPASAATTAAKDGGAPVGAAAAGTATASGQMDGQTYAVRLRDLEARVDELKDQIGRSHRRLALLSDTIMTQGAGGSRSEITFHNEMSSAFKLTRALVTLDGAVQYNRQDDTGALADQKDIPIFSGSVPAGDHTISVVLNFQGNGYGVFTYLRGYKFEVKSSHSFTAVEGKTMTVDATALEKGGVTTPLEQRPTIEWHEKVQSLGAQPVPAAAPPGGAAAPPAPGGAAPAGSASGSVGVSVGGGKK
ncbi:hypothetical protein LZC95_17910 [Pendulispora brunnea]|uniref:Dihydrolipoamide acetyltransferase n=1 Tax=Pendulispora brunnea TaxID=2905690 RepID=A0ABZ2KM63_9BACT